MPVGLALPLGSADHWVVRSRVRDREHNAICAKSCLQRSSITSALSLTPNGPNTQNHMWL